jgi:hypothetical protein
VGRKTEGRACWKCSAALQNYRVYLSSLLET